MLKSKAGATLLRGSDVAPFARAAGGVRHGVGLVEDEAAVEALATPRSDLGQPGRLVLPLLAPERRVGREQDSFDQRDGRPLPEARERHDLERLAAERRPVALGVLDQGVRLGDPDMPAAAAQPVVHQDARDLPPFTRARSVTQEPAAPEAHGIRSVGRRGRDPVEALLDQEGAREMSGMGFTGIDHALGLGVR